MELKAIPRYLRFCAIACLAVFGLAASEHHGVVKFGSVPVPGATVTATLEDKKVVAVTDENGAYTFPDLTDGVWKIQVEMLTFTTLTKEIGVAPNAPGAEWELKMMSMDEIKPSMQAAPAAGAAPTGTAATPSAAPATTAPPAGAPAPPAATQTAAAPPAKGKKGAAAPTTPQQGFQRTDVNASADGAAMSNAAPSIATADATQTASDAFVVNGSSSNGIERRAIGNGRKGPRSLFNGGIDFRGFENDLLDARNYSTSGTDVARAPYTDFTIGGGLQGPLYVPHVFRWQGNFGITFGMTQTRRATNNATVMPTEAERSGDFSQVTNRDGSPITLLDPNTGLAFPGNIIPANRIASQAKYLLNYYPLPQFTAPAGVYNYDVATVNRSRAYQLNTRLNKPLDNRGKNRLNGSFVYTTSNGDNPNIFSFLDTTHTTNYGSSLQYYHNFSRTLYGNFTVNYSRSSTRTTPFFANKTNISGEAGIAGNDQTSFDWGPPNLNFQSGIAALSDASPSFNRNQTLVFSPSVTYMRRPHTFTFGADYRIQDFSIYGQSNGRGTFGFTGLTTGFDFASFLLGVPDTSAIAFGNADKYLKTNVYDLYVNDNWNVSPSLTVQWGLRWDYGSPITEKYGRLVNLDVTQGFANSAPVIAYDPTGSLTGLHYPSSLIKPDKHEVSPRISFAWKPIFGASTLVRGGYGVYYNTSVYMTMAQRMDQQYPLSKSLNIANSAANPLTLANGFVQPVGVTPDTFAVDPDFRVGYSQNWYVSVQQNVSAANLVTVQYSGVKGTRAVQEFQPNTYPIGAANPCQSCLAGYTYLTSNGNSTREAGNVIFRRRFHGGLQSTFTYTYSKSIDDSGGLGTSNAPIAQNWLNLAAERGLSSFDQRHLLNAQFQYSTGVGVHGGALLSGWRGLIIKGWTITSSINVGSGNPFSPTYSLTTPVTGTSGTLRPEYVGGDIYAGTAGRFLNPAAFAAPPPGQWGNAGRDSITGPNQFSMNASMARSFVDNITVTINSNNVLNHPTFPGWNNVFNPALANGGQFGILNSPAAGSMRTVVATLRWTF